MNAVSARLKRLPLRVALTVSAMAMVAMWVGGSAQAVDSDSNNIDDALVVSFAAAGVQNFPDSDAGDTDTVADISFNTSGTPSYSAAGLTNGSTISARNIVNGNTVSVGTGSGTLSLNNAVVWGGAGATGQYAQPGASGNRWTMSFTNTQRYVGLWWSAGNGDNNFQLLDANGNTLLNPTFTTSAITSALLNGNSCPATQPTAAQITANPWLGYCGNPNSTYGYVDEPFAFIHFRFETGFRRIQMWGTGFEFDNLTFSETIPSFGASEEVVGDLSVSSTLPTILLVDPRATSVTLPSIALSNSNNAHACFSQVANSGGSTFSGTPTLDVSRTSNTAGVTQTVTTNLWRYTGSRANIQTQLGGIRISGTNGDPLVGSGSKFLRLHLSSNISGVAGCTDTQVDRVVEIRSVGMTTDTSSGVNFGGSP